MTDLPPSMAPRGLGRRLSIGIFALFYAIALLVILAPPGWIGARSGGAAPQAFVTAD